MCPKGLSGPPVVTLTKWMKWLKYKKDQDIYTIFNRIFINNKDHIRIAGIERSSVILSQTK